MSRYEITDDGRVITITEPNGIFSVLEPTEHGHCIDDASIGAIRQQQADLAALTSERDQLRAECNLLTHKVICCGFAATHENTLAIASAPYSTKWNSAQADSVRKLRSERDQLLARLAAVDAAPTAAFIGIDRKGIARATYFPEPHQSYAMMDLDAKLSKWTIQELIARPAKDGR